MSNIPPEQKHQFHFDVHRSNVPQRFEHDRQITPYEPYAKAKDSNYNQQGGREYGGFVGHKNGQDQ